MENVFIDGRFTQSGAKLGNHLAKALAGIFYSSPAPSMSRVVSMLSTARWTSHKG